MSEIIAAEALLRTAVSAGTDVCFANPGTSEIHVVGALDRVDGMRAILATFEGVCTGAADGFGRMSGRPALTLLHHGPGFANGIANLHNAWRARSPVVNLVGDHPDRHLPFDAPLTSDIASLAAPVSHWVRRPAAAKDLAPDLAEALALAGQRPGHVGTLIVASDLTAEPVQGPAAVHVPIPTPEVDATRIESVAQALRGSDTSIILLGALGMTEPALHAAARVSAATGARLVAETFPSRLERGGDLPVVERLPYFPEHVLRFLESAQHLVLAGASDPVAFFAYADLPSRLVPDSCTAHVLAKPRENAATALEALADALDAPTEPPLPTAVRPGRPSGPLDPPSLGAALAAVQPEGAIVMEEAATSGGPWFPLAAGSPRHTYLGLTGGAIGQGLAVATGAAVACPDRPVIAFQADGGGLYTVQSLWTQAREGLDVTNIICSNRSYRILQFELARAGVPEPGRKAASLTDLTHPDIDWVALAQGFGVPGERVDHAEALTTALERALAEPGPHLIEALL